MSKHSTATYRSPLCKNYWRDAAAEMKNTRTLVVAALMIALRVATKGLAVPIAPNLRIFSVASFINALSAMIIGPVVAIPAAFLSDFLGVLLWEGLGTYFLPYALQEIGSSLIWALLLYRAKVTPWRVILGRFTICILINVLLGTWIDLMYQQYFYGSATVALTVPRILKNTFMFPIEAVIMTLFLNLMIPITNRMGLTYGGETSLSFGKKQIAVLSILFVLGAGCVGGYLFYHYDTTSLSASYTASERLEKNCSMDAIIHAQTDDWDDCTTVTIVESAYKKLGKGYITHNVAVYIVDVDALEAAGDDLKAVQGLSKSKAADHFALKKVASAEIRLAEKSNELLSFSLKKLNPAVD